MKHKILISYLVIISVIEIAILGGVWVVWQYDVPPSCKYSVTIPQLYNATAFQYNTDIGGNSSSSGWSNSYWHFPYTITDSDSVGSNHSVAITYYNQTYTAVAQGVNIAPQLDYKQVGTYTINFQVKETNDQQVSKYGLGFYMLIFFLSVLTIVGVGMLIAQIAGLEE